MQDVTTFRDCLISAVEQGAIDRATAEDLQRRFDELHAQKRLELGDGAAGAAAKELLEKELRAEAIERKRQAVLTAAAQDRIKAYLQGHRAVDGRPDVFDATLNLLESFGQGTVGVQQRALSIVSLAHAQLTDVLAAFRRTAVLGRRLNKPAALDLVRELHGQGSGSESARAMAGAVAELFETLRQRFNAAGGAIAKLDGWGLPHAHDQLAVQKAGRERWIAFTRERIDPAKMRDPLTGEPPSPARLDQLLAGAFDNIVTDGWAHRQPTMQRFGQGALANQRQEHRFLVFRSADDWIAYDREFGTGDPVQAIFGHINGMARDIAAMETLGPNPGAMVEWLKQVNAAELSKHQTGKPSLYREGNAAQEFVGGTPDYLMRRIDQVFEYARGRQTVSSGVANVAGTLRNTLTSAYLGAASLTAVATDPFIDALARRVAGLPIWPAFTAIARTFSGQTREQAVRAGIVLDDFLHIMRDEARFTTISTGAAEWSRWLADRTLTWSGLSPITQARKHVFALEWMGAVADHAALPFRDLPERLRAKLEGYGFDAAQWDILRGTPLHEIRPGAAPIIRPVDAAGVDRDVAERFLGLIMGETERAVPSGTIRSRSALLQGVQRGTVPGELIESMLQFKSFGLSFTTLQLQALQGELAGGKSRGAAYAASLVLALTIGGGLAIQLNNIAQGRDPQPVNDPKFALAALQRGGGFGLFGDFMFADVNRFGSSFAQTLAGPSIGFIGDVGKFTIGNLQELATKGEATNAGREGVQLMRRNTPVASSLWQTRAAYNRVLLDQLQYLADPEAHRAFREQERRFEREQGGSFFWPPGQPVPERAPTLERLTR